MSFSTTGIILCLLAFGYVKAGLWCSDNVNCRCAAFQVAPTKKLLFRLANLLLECDNPKAKEICRTSCLMFVDMPREAIAEGLCKVLNTDVDNIKPALFYSICDETDWEHAVTASFSVCCHEGSPIPCGGNVPDIRSPGEAEDTVNQYTSCATHGILKVITDVIENLLLMLTLH